MAILLQDQGIIGMEDRKCDADVYKGITELTGKCELIFNLVKSGKN